MSTPDSQDDAQTPLAPELLLRLQFRARKILNDVGSELSAIQDEIDRQFIIAAFRFIENPTEDLAEIMNHTTHIGEVIGGYDMQGMAPPPAIDAMHAYLFTLQCINRMNFVEVKLSQGSPISQEIQHAMAQALDWATLLARGYKDETMLSAVNELQGRLGILG